MPDATGVKETIDATLNRISSSGISGASYFTGSIINQVRDDRGAYLAVSSRGNRVMIFGFRTIAALPVVFKTWALFK